MQITAAVDDPAYDQMVESAKEITDPSEFINACHEAESYLYYENVYVIPLDPSEFINACHEAESYLYYENVYVIPLFQNISTYLVQEGLHGYEADGGSTFYGYCYYD